MTWLLVRAIPCGEMTMPVPAATPPDDSAALMLITESSTLSVIASMSTLLDVPVPSELDPDEPDPDEPDPSGGAPSDGSFELGSVTPGLAFDDESWSWPIW